ncbi:MAG: hypothetical protein IK093_11775 [Ruminiclostridium sp.]|nr:hypothetical protein [Ruminiclostridium sp.]
MICKACRKEIGASGECSACGMEVPVFAGNDDPTQEAMLETMGRQYLAANFLAGVSVYIQTYEFSVQPDSMKQESEKSVLLCKGEDLASFEGIWLGDQSFYITPSTLIPLNGYIEKNGQKTTWKTSVEQPEGISSASIGIRLDPGQSRSYRVGLKMRAVAL